MKRYLSALMMAVCAMTLVMTPVGVRAGEEHHDKKDSKTVKEVKKDEESSGDAEKGNKGGKGCWMDCSGSSGDGNGDSRTRSCIRRCR